MTGMRLAKFIADCGVASRRGAEDLIAAGAVTVDGVVVTTPVCFVDNTNTVTVRGREIRPRKSTQIYLFHKPLRTVTTRNDPQGRRTIYDCLPMQYRSLKYVGRLDFMTSGLLLLTNNGGLAEQLMLPKTQIPRTYIATVSCRANAADADLDAARRGMTVDGVHYRPMEIDRISDKTLRVTVREGKNHEVRNVLRACGAPVRQLHRVRYGPFELGKLAPGEIVAADQKTIDALMKTL
ncbi:rRNA pseudouridine synthase [bacterium]|nr:rRNA pseudouridine synthase [bacterium]